MHNMLTFQLFSQLGNIEHGITVIGEEAPSDVVFGEQVHKNNAVWVDAPQTALLPQVDALVTRTSGIAVGVRHADCVPLLFAEPKRGVVGAIHAGWRGTALEITRKTMEFLQFPSHTLLVGIGPAIGPESFKVGQEVAEQFPRSCVEQVDEEVWTVDLWQANIEQLLEVGVREKNIEVIRRDTCTDPDLYSFRAGDREERNITWIRRTV